MMDTDRADFLQPVLRRVLFWDVPLENIDLDTHADWLIARVLWRGTLVARAETRRALDLPGPHPPIQRLRAGG